MPALSTLMRSSVGWLVVLGLCLTGCGGSTTKDGSGAGGAGGGGGSGAVAGAAGIGGTAGGAPGCCSPGTTYDCKSWGDELACVAGVCKQAPPAGLCWSDLDCGAPGSKCEGASVCPCGALCDSEDLLGKCSVPPGCCSTDTDCPQKPGAPMVCVGGNCEPKPPQGQCWSDADCITGTPCSGACVCPCGAVCACGGVMGTCLGQPPPPSFCCSSSIECGPNGVCAKGVCKEPVAGACWTDLECPKGTQCSGESVCPCGADCGMIDKPGQCL